MSEWSNPAGEDVDVAPLHDRIVLERIEDSPGLILLTDKDATRTFRVLKVGPGAWRDGEFVKTVVKPGDVVILPGIAATHPDYEDKRYILAQERDIGCIVEHG